MPATGQPHIWCNASPGIRLPAILRVLDRVVSESDGITATLSASRGVELPPTLPRGVARAERPIDLRQTMDKFVAEIRPKLAVFAGSDVMPAAIDACVSAGTATILICGETQTQSGLRRRWSDFRLRNRLRRVDHVFAASSRDAHHLRRLGADPERIEILGPLEEGTQSLPCDEREWDALADLMTARPVWLAAMVRKSELPAVEEAQRAASRTSHRLLLIAVPESASDGPAMAEWFREQGWQTGLRSAGADPDPDNQVYVADEEGELGLWYRLAPISFIGASLSPSEGGGHDPYGPATLGSAIVHGPHVTQFTSEFRRLGEGGGTRSIRDGAGLGAAVAELLSPDRAARQAHRAWEITFQGAEASDRVVGMIRRLIDERVA